MKNIQSMDMNDNVMSTRRWKEQPIKGGHKNTDHQVNVCNVYNPQG